MVIETGMERGGQRQLKGCSPAQGCKSRAARAALTSLPQGAGRWGAGEARLCPEMERYGAGGGSSHRASLQRKIPMMSLSRLARGGRRRSCVRRPSPEPLV